MACFVVPMTLAMIIGAIRKKIPAVYHINWLMMLLGGGVISLVIDHIASGEIVPYPPFLTAMSTPAQTAVMINEIATLGSAMAVACVAIWLSLVLYVSKKENSKTKIVHQ